MKLKHTVISILAVLFSFPFGETFAQPPAPPPPSSGSIDLIATFNYPGTGNITLPQKINERGDIVGVYIDPSGVTRGFVRFRDGSFSAPIVDPNDTTGFTEARGINNQGTVCGDYTTSDGNHHGFLLSGGTFTEYDAPGALSTSVLGINDSADFTGSFSSDGVIFDGYITSRGGLIRSFGIPEATVTLAYDINDSRQLVIGYYVDSSGIAHGYYRETKGATLHFPIDPPGSIGTVLFGNNNRNWVVGRYVDSSNVTHGLFFLPPNSFSTYDVPGATLTSLNGISNQGLICGRYIDASGTSLAFLARVRGTPPTKQAPPPPSALEGAMPER